MVNGRFVSTVTLDGGAVTILPAPRRLHPRRAESAVETQIWATEQIMSYRRQILGFGIATITKKAPGVPRVTKLPAWIGLATRAGLSVSCPSLAPDPRTPPLPVLPSDGEAAVILGDAGTAPAVVYQARSVICESVTPAQLTNALESLSIPWTQVGPVNDGVLELQATVPQCGQYSGASSGGTAKALTVTIYSDVPEDTAHRHCPAARVVDESLPLGPVGVPGAPPPVVSAGTAILHGETGPVRVVGPIEPPGSEPDASIAPPAPLPAR